MYGFKAHKAFGLPAADGKVIQVGAGFMIRTHSLKGDTVTLQVIDPRDPAGAVLTEAPAGSSNELFSGLHASGALEYLEGEADFRKAMEAGADSPQPQQRKKKQSTALCVIVLGVLLLALCGAKSDKKQ